MDIRQYLSSKGYQWTEHDRPTGKVAVMNCPFCGDTKKKFGVSLKDGAFNCLRLNECGATGSFYDLQRLLGDVPVRLDDDKIVYRKEKKVYRPIDKHSSKLSPKIYDYLENARKFKKAFITKFRIGAQDENTIMLPYFKAGKIVNIKYRTLDKKMWQEKEAEPALYNRDNCSGAQLIITEGEFDTIAFAHYDLDAVSVPSGASDTRWIEHEWEYLQQFKSIYLAVDQDEAGQKAANKMATRLGKWRCYRVRLPYKDANDCLKNDVPAEAIMQCFADAADFTPVNLVRVESYLEDVTRLFEDTGALNGISTGWEALNKILRGWRDEEMTVWSGRNGSGKSTILNQVILNNARSQIRSCIVSLEMPVVRLLRWMIIQHYGFPNPSKDGIKKAVTYLNEYVFFVNLIGEAIPEEILNCFEFAARKYGVKQFFVDSLMRISIDLRNELASQKEFCSHLLEFANEHKAHVHLVAHPRKGRTDEQMPDKVDIAGTGDITNLAHNVITMSRVGEREKQNMISKGIDELFDATVMVKKNREWGDEGVVRMKFDNDVKRFTELKKYFVNGVEQYLEAT